MPSASLSAGFAAGPGAIANIVAEEFAKRFFWAVKDCYPKRTRISEMLGPNQGGRVRTKSAFAHGGSYFCRRCFGKRTTNSPPQPPAPQVKIALLARMIKPQDIAWVGLTDTPATIAAGATLEPPQRIQEPHRSPRLLVSRRSTTPRASAVRS